MNPWSDDPDYPSDDWKYEVANDQTRRGYLDWVAAMREQESPEPSAPVLLVDFP